MSLEKPGSIIKVDSKGNAEEVPLITAEELSNQMKQSKRGIQPIIDHFLETRERMIQEEKDKKR